MKTIIISIFLLVSVKSFSQTCDVLYVPDDKSLLVTYCGYSRVGFYVGGHIVTSISEPFYYTTPASIINRAGLNLTFNNRYSLMVGSTFEKNTYELRLKPDFWVKINPLRIIFKTPKGYDLSLAAGYSKKFVFGLGLSINYW